MFYYNKECKRLTTPGAVSYNALRNISNPLKPGPWKPNDLYTNVPMGEALEDMADFFNGISDEFVGLEQSDIPTTFDRECVEITPARIIEKVKVMKRPKKHCAG